jgi:hypothetical protein
MLFQITKPLLADFRCAIPARVSLVLWHVVSQMTAVTHCLDVAFNYALDARARVALAWPARCVKVCDREHHDATGPHGRLAVHLNTTARAGMSPMQATFALAFTLTFRALETDAPRKLFPAFGVYGFPCHIFTSTN